MQRVIEENINTRGFWDKTYRSEVGRKTTSWNCHSAVTVLSAVLPKSAHVLDCACGSAFGPLRVSERRTDLRWSGCDYSSEIVEWHKRQSFSWERIFLADIMKIKESVSPGQYDVLMACEVLEHLESPESVARAIASLPSKQAIITVPYLNRVASPDHVWSIDEPDVRGWLEPFGRVETYIVRHGTKIIAVCDRR
jgi:2-polyprenyl-3-methyl-5-hydroxy-6-metoxy-1,4-benzoquinol methylase